MPPIVGKALNALLGNHFGRAIGVEAAPQKIT